MQYRPLGDTGLSVSCIGLGTWAMGGGTDWGPADDAQSLNAVSAALDAGINLIDTAPIYGFGHAEEVVGRALSGRRDKVFLATKCGLIRFEKGINHWLKPDSVAQELEDSLRRLRTDYIDLYQIHWPDPHTPLEDTLHALARLQAQGKIRFIGVCNFDAPLLARAAEAFPVACVQQGYSFLDREKAQAVFPLCRAHRLGFLGYGSLAGGILSGKYKKEANIRRCDARSYFYRFYKGERFIHTKEITDRFVRLAQMCGKPASAAALSWALARQEVSCALCGARTPEQVLQNVQAARWRLTPQELDFLEGDICKP